MAQVMFRNSHTVLPTVDMMCLPSKLQGLQFYIHMLTPLLSLLADILVSSFL